MYHKCYLSVVILDWLANKDKNKDSSQVVESRMQNSQAWRVTCTYKRQMFFIGNFYLAYSSLGKHLSVTYVHRLKRYSDSNMRAILDFQWTPNHRHRNQSGVLKAVLQHLGTTQSVTLCKPGPLKSSQTSLSSLLRHLLGNRKLDMWSDPNHVGLALLSVSSTWHSCLWLWLVRRIGVSFSFHPAKLMQVWDKTVSQKSATHKYQVT